MRGIQGRKGNFDKLVHLTEIDPSQCRLVSEWDVMCA